MSLVLGLVEARDHHTASHMRRTQSYVRLLAQELQGHPLHAAALSDDYVDLLVRAAPLHDIGKVGIPDRILNKPSQLTDDELSVMRTHCAIGAQCIERVYPAGEPPPPFLEVVRELARWHHERWDGTGYPDSLRGDAIPLSARIMAVADVFDALTSRRPYKLPMTIEAARSLIHGGAGGQFDSDVVDAFERRFDAMSATAGAHADGLTDRP